MKPAKFKLRDEVEKHTGDDVLRGIVVSIFETPAGDVRYVVAHAADKGHVLHICSEDNLREVRVSPC